MTLQELLALLPDNDTGAIDAADLRAIVTDLWNRDADPAVIDAAIAALIGTTGSQTEDALSLAFIDRPGTPTTSSPHPVYNLLDYGIVGDGVTDNSVALAALFASLPASGFSIQAPAGQYVHDGTYFTGKTDFTFEGPGEFLIKATTLGGGGYLGFSDCHRFTVSGVKSRHITNSPARASGQGFNLVNCTNFTIENCEAQHTESIGIKLFACLDGTVATNSVHNTVADGIGLYGECERITVIGNRLKDVGDDAIATVGVQVEDPFPPRHITITGNVIVGSVIAHAIVVAGGEDVAITGNVCDYTSAGAIFIQSGGSRLLHGCKRVTVSGNTIFRANQNAATINQGDISVLGQSAAFPCEDVVISNNVMTLGNYRHISIGNSGSEVGATARVKVIGNTVSTGDSVGLYVQNVLDIEVIGNTFDNCLGTSAVYFSADVRGQIVFVNNRIREGGSSSFAAVSAVSLPSVTQALFAGNVIHCKADAIYGMQLDSTLTIFTTYGNAISGGTLAPIHGGLGFMHVRGNVTISAVAANAASGGGMGVLAIRNAQTLPSTNPVNGGIIYVEGGALKFRGSAGTVTTIAPA